METTAERKRRVQTPSAAADSILNQPGASSSSGVGTAASAAPLPGTIDAQSPVYASGSGGAPYFGTGYDTAMVGGGGGEFDTPRNRFTEAEARLLMEWHLEAKYRLSGGHAIQARKYREYEIWAGMPSVIVCLVAATMAMGTERSKDGEVFKYFLCILSVFGTILSFIFANTQFTQRFEQHKNCWTAYLIFANDAEAALARNAANDRWFNAQQHLDVLYERWKELKGPSFDIPALPEPERVPPPGTAEIVIHRWQLFAEQEMLRHQIAAQTYDWWMFIWRCIWMMIAALCSAASLGTFLPKNTEWYIAFSYISLLLNIFVVIIMAYMNFRRYSVSSEQHTLVAHKCRIMHDCASKLLAQRPRTGPADEYRLGDAIDTLRSMLNDIVVHAPLLTSCMNTTIEKKTPMCNVYCATGGTTANLIPHNASPANAPSSSVDGAHRRVPSSSSAAKLLS